MNIFVGNLSFDATGGDVKKLFEGFGNVASVAIVMRKEKKAPKSRGFGFVEMPDEQQALAAIDVLNGKEFMGRVLNVDPARPKGQKAMVWLPIAKAKTEAQAASESKEKGRPKFKAQAQQYSREERERGKTLVSPVFNKHLALKAPRPNGRAGTPPSAVDGRVRLSGQPGTYKGGRRTHSYMKRQVLTGVQEDTKPRCRSQDNPMRWRKKKDKPRPWQKSPGEHKPWEKAKGEARPWKKAEGEFKPWRKSEGGIKPWKKPAGDAKPWTKSSERPQKSRFNPSTSPGMVRGNGERSRTKSRVKSGGYKR
jgi:RNA recognition motif-containing protein